MLVVVIVSVRSYVSICTSALNIGFVELLWDSHKRLREHGDARRDDKKVDKREGVLPASVVGERGV